MTFGEHLFLASDFSIRSYKNSHAYADPILTGSDITALMEQAYVGAGYGSASWTLGRDRSRWGLGQTGSLILSDAAAPATILEYELAWRTLHARAQTAVLDPATGEYASSHRLECQASRRVYPGLR